MLTVPLQALTQIMKQIGLEIQIPAYYEIVKLLNRQETETDMVWCYSGLQI